MPVELLTQEEQPVIPRSLQARRLHFNGLKNNHFFLHLTQKTQNIGQVINSRRAWLEDHRLALGEHRYHIIRVVLDYCAGDGFISGNVDASRYTCVNTILDNLFVPYEIEFFKVVRNQLKQMHIGLWHSTLKTLVLDELSKQEQLWRQESIKTAVAMTSSFATLGGLSFGTGLITAALPGMAMAHQLLVGIACIAFVAACVVFFFGADMNADAPFLFEALQNTTDVIDHLNLGSTLYGLTARSLNALKMLGEQITQRLPAIQEPPAREQDAPRLPRRPL